MAQTNKAKILLYDLEVSPILGWGYGPSWETRFIKIEQYQKIMSISWRWFGEKKIYHENLSTMTEARLMKLIRDLLDSCDIAIAHNGKRFDDRISRGAFLMANLTPPSPFKNVDTKIVAKQVGLFPSNSLNDLCEMFGFGTKTKETYADLWYDAFILHNKKAWKKMEKYNNQDVELLTKLYEKLLPYANTHPNVANIAGDSDACPRCGGHNLVKRGTRATNVSVYQRYRCDDCGAWPTGRTAIKDAPKPTYNSYNS